MMAASMLVLCIVQLFMGCALSQNHLYSLQPAVDALHRREAQLWLESPETFKHNNNYNAEGRQQPSYGRSYRGDEIDEIDDEYEPYVEERKRSIFRERGDVPRPSAFREREPIQPELAAQFMEAIEHERAAERDQRYKEQLHRLWQKYQQQENDLEEKLFENENENEPSDIRYQYVPTDDDRVAAVADDHYGVAEKRRLVMPWLPVSKRSFPMSKRSSAPYAKLDASISGTDEKVARDLQAIFAGSSGADRSKSKRSSRAERTAVTDVTDVTHQTTSSTTTTKPNVSDSKEDHAHEDTESRSVVSHQRDQHDNHDLDHDGYLEEHEHDHDDHDHEHDHEHDHDDEHENDEDEESVEDHDETSDKKKRATINKVKRGNQEVLKEDQIIPGDLTDFKRKKSVEWSKYFGIDRRKKSTEWATADKPKTLEDYAPTHFRNHDQVVARPKLEVNEKKLENMDHKLKSIEELIIDETIKYNAEHEGITNPEDIQKLRDHVISRLATAYSLEKMRRALEKLKQSVDLERHLSLNEFEEAHKAEDGSAEAQDKNKRVAIKKEKVQYENNQHNIDSVTEHMFNGNDMLKSNSADIDEPTHQPQEKKAQFAPMMTMYNENHHKSANNPPMLVSYDKRPSPSAYDSMLKQFTPIEEYANNAVDDECPLLDAMEKRCRAVNLLSGDIRQQFLPQCGVHQLCYLCGSSESACDYQYAAEAGTLCGNNEECHAAARTALLILRESTGPQMGPRECALNSCLRRALMEIGAM